MAEITPEISYKHVLTELSVNRSDPCEVVRELISNSYDAKATELRLATIADSSSVVFFDNGEGLSHTKEINGITPYRAFFSIGKSTKTRGDGGVGYKCQGSKLCFACNRFLVITKEAGGKDFVYRIIDNPRDTLATGAAIDPSVCDKPWEIIKSFFEGANASTINLLKEFGEEFFKKEFTSGTLIAVRGLDTDNFDKYLLAGPTPVDSYLVNYIRYFTKHGDTRKISRAQGFKETQVHQFDGLARIVKLQVWNGTKFEEVPFGFHYLPAVADADIKMPLEIVRLRDGRFYSRNAKRLTFSDKTYCLVFVIDGNRRALDEYKALSRKRAMNSGIKLSDQRGVWVSTSGIKICRYPDLFSRPELQDYAVLGESESTNHYHLIIDGDFELVTNRNSLSRSASLVLENANFVAEVKKFLDYCLQTDPVFKQLLSRLNREQSEAELGQQISILKESKDGMKDRERFDIGGRVYVSPEPGEEYLVGVLYAELGAKIQSGAAHSDYWKRILTFSTQGIDSLGANNEKTLKADDLIAIEYKYSFSNAGPFNHALCLVDLIVAWEVDLEVKTNIRDQYGCYGRIKQNNDGTWSIFDINHVEGENYGDRSVLVICLRDLIQKSFDKVVFRKP